MNNLQNYVKQGFSRLVFLKRLPLEMENYNKIKDILFQEFGFTINKTSDNGHYELNIFGPENSPYQNGFFQAEISITKYYPFSPLSVNFLTKIYHQNISIKDGSTYLEINSRWKPSYGLIYMAIRTYLLLNRDQYYSIGVYNEKAFYITRQKDNYGVFLSKVNEYIDKYAKMNSKEKEQYFFLIENIKKEREKAKQYSLNNNNNYININYYLLNVSMNSKSIDVNVNMKIIDILEQIVGSENKNLYFVLFLGQVIDTRRTVKEVCFYQNCHFFIIDEMTGFYW